MIKYLRVDKDTLLIAVAILMMTATVLVYMRTCDGATQQFAFDLHRHLDQVVKNIVTSLTH